MNNWEKRKRTQLYLESDQHDFLKTYAQMKGWTVSQVVRDLVDKFILKYHGDR